MPSAVTGNVEEYQHQPSGDTQAKTGDAPGEARGWTLRVGGRARAFIGFAADALGARRVSIFDPGEHPWDVQINRPRYRIHAGNRYRVQFSVRSDAPRSAWLGVSMAHEPWEGLGLYQMFDTTPEWQKFSFEFVAAAGDENARLHLDVGSSSVAIEVSAADLLDEQGEPVRAPHALDSIHGMTPVSRVWGFDRGLPVDRFYIEKFLTQHSADVKGRVLEIGDDFYTRKFGGERVRQSDVLNVREGADCTTITGDLASASHIPDEAFDCIILTQTLQLIYDVRAAVATLYRILKPGGVLLATFPGISQNNDRDWNTDWYWCFTPVAARRLFGESFRGSDVEIQTFGNVWTASAFLYGLAADELTFEELAFNERGYEVTIAVRACKPVESPIPALGIIRAHPDQTGRAAILMYHRIGPPEADPFSLSVSSENFAAQLRVLRNHGRVVSLRTLGECVRERCVPDRFIALTFDDGYADNLYAAKPMLDSLHVPATVFVATGNLARSGEQWWDALERILLQSGMLPEVLNLTIEGEAHRWTLEPEYPEEVYAQHRSWKFDLPAPTQRHAVFLKIWNLLRSVPCNKRNESMRELAEWSGRETSPSTHRCMDYQELKRLAEDGWIAVGAHSVTHPWLPGLSSAQQQQEIAGSKQELEKCLGTPVSSFAYPYGAHTPETLELAARAGIDLACTTVPGLVTAQSGLMRLPRFQVCDWTADQFEARLNQWFGHPGKSMERTS